MPDRYDPWQPAAIYLDTTRRRVAAELLYACGAFPAAGQRCLEVGFGERGWLGHLIDWGVCERDLCGLDARADCVQRASDRLPAADLRAGDAAALPWPRAQFDVVIASMLFTAILDPAHRQVAASEISRVLAPTGVLLYYDIAVPNPCNRTYRKVTRREVGDIFPDWSGAIRAIGLPPPVARLIAPRSWVLATLLDAISPVHPFLLGVLRPPAT